MERCKPARPLSALTRTAAVVISLAAGATVAAGAPAPPPAADKRPAEDRYFDSTVRDDYQWMENWSDPALRSWVEGQNAYTRGILDQIPSRPAIRDRVAELSRDISPDYSALAYRG